MINKLICKIFNHKYKYNFKSLPSKAICSRCKTKWYFPYGDTKVSIFERKWIEIDKFTFTPGCERDDEELIKQWVN